MEYSADFEVSFEYKAHSVPSSGSFHQMIIGKVISSINTIPFQLVKSLKASPDGRYSNQLFGFYFQAGYGYYALVVGGLQVNFDREFIANKWYKASSYFFVVTWKLNTIYFSDRHKTDKERKQFV